MEHDFLYNENQSHSKGLYRCLGVGESELLYFFIACDAIITNSTNTRLKEVQDEVYTRYLIRRD